MSEAKLSPEVEERIEKLRAFIYYKLRELEFNYKWDDTEVGHEQLTDEIMTYLSENGFLICPTCAARHRTAVEIPNGILTVTTDGEILSMPWEGKR